MFEAVSRRACRSVPAAMLLLALAVVLSSAPALLPQSKPVSKPSRVSAPAVSGRRAKNVILFLGDAGGIPTLHAASLMAHNDPNALFIQSMPHIALMDTSAANAWVTDSAAGMSAIVTGHKTNNSVLSQSPDGEIYKTVLEYAEERGLSTGIVVNTPVTDATGAACYAHVPRRNMAADIFSQLLSPACGDGVDVLIGPGRQQILKAIAPLGIDLESALKGKGYAYSTTPDGIPRDARRVAALFDTQDFDLRPLVQRAIDILSRNPKGFFLVVECDMHTDDVKAGLERAIVGDELVRETCQRMKNDTLVMYAADHSFDVRVRAGKPGEPLVLPPPEGQQSPPGSPKPAIRVDDGHTGEQVLVAADGPGAERVHGFIRNTDLFRVMMNAYGWKPAAAAAAPAAHVPTME